MAPRLLILLLACLLLPAATDPAPPSLAPGLTRRQAFARAQALAELGRQMFFDPTLSASGRVACASCHDPAHAYSPPNDLAVQPGGALMDRVGTRATPGLTYLQAVPPFTEHFHDSDDEADGSVDNGPTGGLNWDGRADSGAVQSAIPLLSPDEMANPSPAAFVQRAAAAGHLARLRTILDEPLQDEAAAFAALRKAFEVFEQDAATFYPYASRYDAYLAGRAPLSDQEMRGLAAFNDPERGNCARCHISARGRDGTPPQFTDFGLVGIGVPRNPELPANVDPAYHDLGLCGPYRTDLADHPEYCGLFRTPSLRNVALKRRFFHNGAMRTLRDAVAFYASRDTDPAHWYPKSQDGTVQKFDDLPAAYHPNLDSDPPFEGRQPNDPPTLTNPEIDDIVTFLQTLTDSH